MSYPKHHTEPFWPTYRLTGPIKNTNPIGMPSRFGPAMGSYYESKYYQNPVPYTSSDIGEPVPGWGTTVSVAGPARLGVGALGLMVASGSRPAAQLSRRAVMDLVTAGAQQSSQDYASQSSDAPPPPPADDEEGGIPWWIWPAAASITMIGIGYFGTKKGWF